MAKQKLTGKMKKFIDSYLGPAKFNATEAAKMAGYSEKTAAAIGWENLRKLEIKEEIARRLAETVMSPEETLKEMSERARDRTDGASPKMIELLGKHYGFFEHTQKQQTLNIDLDQFSDEELQKIAGGGDPLQIMASREDDN